MRSLKIPGPAWQKVMARLFLGWRKPKRPILRMDLSGEIEETGRNVTYFQVGEAVFASSLADNFGGYAEYKCLPAKGVMALKPDNLSFKEAAAIPGAGMTALHYLPQKDKASVGAEGLGIWCVWRSRHKRCPACQPLLQGRCDWCVQRR